MKHDGYCHPINESQDMGEHLCKPHDIPSCHAAVLIAGAVFFEASEQSITQGGNVKRSTLEVSDIIDNTKEFQNWATDMAAQFGLSVMPSVAVQRDAACPGQTERVLPAHRAKHKHVHWVGLAVDLPDPPECDEAPNMPPGTCYPVFFPYTWQDIHAYMDGSGRLSCSCLPSRRAGAYLCLHDHARSTQDLARRLGGPHALLVMHMHSVIWPMIALMRNGDMPVALHFLIINDVCRLACDCIRLNSERQNAHHYGIMQQTSLFL